MKIALMPNLTRKEAFEVTGGICSSLDKLGADYCFLPEYADIFGMTKAAFLPEEEALGCCDAVIAVGGDGSIIHAAKSAVRYQKPILGTKSTFASSVREPMYSRADSRVPEPSE